MIIWAYNVEMKALAGKGTQKNKRLWYSVVLLRISNVNRIDGIKI